MSKNTLFKKIGSSAIALIALCLVLNSCKDEDVNKATELKSWGPSPALRGGELRFIGTNLDKVTAIILPPAIEITTFKTKSATLLVIDVPQETMEGKVVLKTPEGDLETKTMLGISEPIVLTSFSPLTIRPGETITLTGDYLNLIEEVIFASNKRVSEFSEQSRTTLKLVVPLDAQSGLITISDGEEEPILVESETALEVSLPTATQIAPNPVKAGAALTITGTNLDLTTEVIFGGTNRVSADNFTSQTATQIVVNVPANSQDGAIKLVAASLVNTESASLTMVVPTITSVSPNPAKNGQTITVVGTNLDLINTVTFGGDKTGSIQNGGTATQIIVNIPNDAIAGTVVFGTRANKSVSAAQSLNFVKPAITSMSPLSLKSNENVTVIGTNLDLVKGVLFGAVEVVPLSASETELVVKVPSGTQSGTITLVAKNGDQEISSDALTILPSNVPTVTSMPINGKPGQMITIEGEKFDLAADVIFPGNVKATTFGIKTATSMQVLIPTNVAKGYGRITFLTTEGESSESPIINIQGVDPVLNEAYVFFDFNGTGNKDRWWGDAGAYENEASLSVDGTPYFRVNENRSGWTGLFWRNGKNNFPADQIGTDISGHVVKFDINILEPMTGGQLRLRLKGSSGDFWYLWAPWSESGSYQTDGWITVTIPIADFRDNFGDGSGVITDLSAINEDFGIAFDGGSSMVNICIDNVRFEEVN